MEYDGIFSVTFTNSPVAPNGVGLFPVQPLEALLNIVLTVILTALYLRKVPKGIVTATYILCYSVIRFCLEFLRGDGIRGVFIISTSQWISIFMFLVGVGIILYSFKKDKKPIS